MKSIILILITLSCLSCKQIILFRGIEDGIIIYQPVSKEFISKATQLINSCKSKVKINKVPQPNFVCMVFSIGKKKYLFTIDKNNLPLKKIIIYERNREGNFLLDNYTEGYEEIISIIQKGIPSNF